MHWRWCAGLKTENSKIKSYSLRETRMSLNDCNEGLGSTILTGLFKKKKKGTGSALSLRCEPYEIDFR